MVFFFIYCNYFLFALRSNRNGNGISRTAAHSQKHFGTKPNRTSDTGSHSRIAGFCCPNFCFCMLLSFAALIILYPVLS